MHDFLLAKEIVDEVIKTIKERKIVQVKRVSLEIGQIALAHDGYEEHIEDISIDNLQFGINAITKGTVLEKTEFDIMKVNGGHWRLTNIEV